MTKAIMSAKVIEGGNMKDSGRPRWSEPAPNDRDPAERQHKDISRATMTVWIVGTLGMIALFGLAIGLRIANEDPRYPGCTSWFGIEMESCRLDHAVRRMGGGK